MLKHLASTGLLVLLFFAGCTDVAGDADDDPNATVPRVGGPSTERGPPEAGLGGVANYTATLERCQQVTATGDVPVDQALGVLPTAFRPKGFSPETAGFLLRGLVCERAAVNQTLFHGVSVFHTMLFVEPVNSTWSTTGIDWYMLETFTSGFDFPAWDVDQRAEFSFTNTSGSSAWVVEGGGETFSLEAVGIRQPGSEAQASYTLWAGTEAFLPIGVHSAYVYDRVHVGPIVVRIDGSGKTEQALGASVPAIGGLITSDIVFSMDWSMSKEPRG